MDAALKNSLWNLMYAWFWEHYARKSGQTASYVSEGKMLLSLWAGHFNEPADRAEIEFSYVLRQVRELYMEGAWWEVYDFVEFVAGYPRPQEASVQFIAACNAVLEKHLSAFVGGILAPITSEEEILGIERAMSHGGKFSPTVSHLETALARLADHSSPDYRNSIKESISAVEAVCQIITGDQKATLGQALKKIGIHPALEKGFSAIDGYTSDADGIRHALLEESTVDADDAKFFFVSCSAFVNHLIAKSTSSTTVT